MAAHPIPDRCVCISNVDFRIFPIAFLSSRQYALVWGFRLESSEQDDAMSTKVILADDHKIIRDGLRSMIQKVPGIELVAEAENGKMAVQLSAEHRPDIVIMDINMPGLNGIDATGLILAQQPAIKIIGLSMYADRRIVEEMFKAGALGYVLKDCAFDELSDAMGTVISGRVYLSPYIKVLLIEKNFGRIRKNGTLARIMALIESEAAAISEGVELGRVSEKVGELNLFDDGMNIFWIFGYGLRPWSGLLNSWDNPFKGFQFGFDMKNLTWFDPLWGVNTFTKITGIDKSPKAFRNIDAIMNKGLNSYRNTLSTCIENINDAANQGYNVGLKSVDLAGRNLDVFIDWVELNIKANQALGKSAVEFYKSAAGAFDGKTQADVKPVFQTLAEGAKTTTRNLIEDSQVFVSVPKFIESCAVCMKLTATHYKRLTAFPYSYSVFNPVTSLFL